MSWNSLNIYPPEPYRIVEHLHTFSLPGKPLPCIVEAQEFRRLVPIRGEYVPLRVEIDEQSPALHIFWQGDAPAEKIERIVEHIFAVDVDYSAFLSALEGYPALYHLAEKYRGLRPARSLNLYEALIKVILQQRISLRIAFRITAKLIERYGLRSSLDGRTFYSMPSPESLSSLSVDELRKLGTTRMKARAIIEVARRAELDELPGETEESENALMEKLMEIYGVGRWTAELAVASVAHSFSVGPAGDLTVLKGARRLLGVNGEAELRDFLRSFGEWKGLLMYLLALEAHAGKRS